MQVIIRFLEISFEVKSNRLSTRDRAAYLSTIRNSGMDLMKLTSNEKNGSRPLDVIYEGLNSISNMPNLKQKEILDQYYLQSRRNLKPFRRMLNSPLMTADNNIQFVNNGWLIK